MLVLGTSLHSTSTPVPCHTFFSMARGWKHYCLFVHWQGHLTNHLHKVSLLIIAYYSTSFSIMVKCWALDSEDRPTFEKLSTTLEKLLQMAAGYLELNMVLPSPGNADEDESG